MAAVIESLWKLGFTPKVFKKLSTDRKSKGVDIALATDMLVNSCVSEPVRRGNSLKG
jgi:hypothetical protein